MRMVTWLFPALGWWLLGAAPAPQRLGLPPDREGTIDETGPTNAAGFVRGRVTGIDPAAGRVALDSGGQPVTLNAKPADLADLAPGREVSLPFENYGGHLWVTPVEAPNPPPTSRTVEGTVTGLDKNEGRVEVDGTPYLAHPDDLAALAPGRPVRLGVADVGGRSWAVRVVPRRSP
jgi:hypothetical protein